MDAWIAAAVFVIAYALIALERWDRTLIAMIGGLLVVVLGVIDQHEAFAAIDLNVIFLLAGMMVIASILARTGFFEWLAIRSVRLSNGHPIRLLLILAIVTAVLSAFLDNVTTVVLMTPITLSVARRLDISPMPYLISGILASNIGGTATLIGDPPNILIGSAAGLGFDDFLLNLAPVTVLIFLAFLVIVRFSFRGVLQVPDERREAALEQKEESAIKDRPLLIRSLVVTAATIAGFLVHSAIGVEPATIALLGAMVLMLIAGLDPHRTLREIEWSTLFFFVGLFILVEALVQVGIVGGIADQLARATEGQQGVATIGLLWFSAIASAIVDNIPYTATAIPVVERLAEAGMNPLPLWWALALGACLGGNLTIVGASANVVVANLAARAGHPIRFVEFVRYGSVVVVVSLVISTAYVWFRYLA
ncbi:MAG: ArsB/NhaD family transporter [Candidatus Limnocylindrales bacterium]